MNFLYPLLLHFAIGTGSRERSFRVVGGRDVRSGEFPYVVRFELKEPTTNLHIHICSASVLTATATLTAAHCCVPVDEYKRVIRYGSAPGRPTEDDRFSDVLNCFKHPAMPPFPPLNLEYFMNTLSPMRMADLALLATQPIHVSEYARLSAVDYRALYGQRVRALGYGITEHSSGNDDTLVLKLPLQVLDAMWSRCDESLIKMYPMVCLAKACGSRGALCQGDSGGPVVHASGVVGVVSMGTAPGCQSVGDHIASLEYITSISNYIDWITDRLADTTLF